MDRGGEISKILNGSAAGEELDAHAQLPLLPGAQVARPAHLARVRQADATHHHLGGGE